MRTGLNENSWLKLKFTASDFGQLTCPTCQSGILQKKGDNFFESSNSETKQCSSELWFEIEMCLYRFSAMLECSSQNCREAVVVVGDGRIERFHEVNDHTGRWDEWEESIYTPKFFYPPLNIIPILEEYDERIKPLMSQAFSFFFSDTESCANKIRVVLEELMTCMKVRKTLDTKKGRIRLKLHDRIESFKTKNPENGDRLLAIKWIGNAGSHTGSVSQKDILQAFRILDVVLRSIYSKRDKELDLIVAKINKRKGVLSGGRSKRIK